MPIWPVVLTLATIGLAWQPAQDPFVARRDAAASRNPHSSRFTIALEAGRRSFRIGERIPLLFTYDDLGRSRYGGQHLSYLHVADAVLDRRDGTADPLGDFGRAAFYLPGGACCGVEGGVAGGMARFGGMGIDANGVPYFLPNLPPLPRPKPPPVTFTVLLNEGVRFDRPGRYRLYMSDHHDRHHSLTTGHKPEPLISNMVEFEITARDAAWEERAAVDAAAILDSSRDESARTTAMQTLRVLGTDRAIDEMAHRMARRVEGRNATENLENVRQYMQGLFGVRNRARAIASLEKELSDPDRPVTWDYLRTLAALKVAQPPGRPFTSAEKRAQLDSYFRRRLGVLQNARTLTDALTASFERMERAAAQDPESGVIPAMLSPAIASFPREVEAALGRLPPSTQRLALINGWQYFLDRRFVPMLERMVRAGGQPATVALRLLNESAPSRARVLTANDAALAAVIAEAPYEWVSPEAGELTLSYRVDEEHRGSYALAGNEVPSSRLLEAARKHLVRGMVISWRGGYYADSSFLGWVSDPDEQFLRAEGVLRSAGIHLRK